MRRAVSLRCASRLGAELAVEHGGFAEADGEADGRYGVGRLLEEAAGVGDAVARPGLDSRQCQSSVEVFQPIQSVIAARTLTRGRVRLSYGDPT
jgi:hypothetical protein